MKENIEEDIKILENMNDGYTFKDCDICNNYNEKTKQCDKHKCMELQAIEHILSDYKRVLKINEVLLKENEELKKFHIQDNKHLDFIMKNSITVQKVKAKIEELNIAISECEYLDDDDERYKKAVEKDKLYLLNQKRILKQLLESEE